MRNKSTEFLQWIDFCAAEQKVAGHFGQSINYRKAGRSFARFLESSRQGSVFLADINTSIINRYNVWLQGSGMLRNSVSFYNRQLRAIYNKAVKKRMIRNRHPFAEVYTGIDKTRKRAVSLKEIARICYDCDAATMLARDLFEFSFSTCGMPFVDMVYLRKTNIRENEIYYSRRKTSSPITIPLSAKSLAIIKKYASQTKDSQYVFPILGNATGEEAYNRYLTALSYYNKSLKHLAREAGVSKELTSYVARHSWATAARNNGAPIAVISSALGHTNEKTTQVYLDSLDLTKLAAVNLKILREIMQKA